MGPRRSDGPRGSGSRGAAIQWAAELGEEERNGGRGLTSGVTASERGAGHVRWRGRVPRGDGRAWGPDGPRRGVAVLGLRTGEHGPARGSRPGKRGEWAAREKGKRRRVGPVAGLPGLRWAAVGWVG